MTNSTVSRIGQVNQAGAVDALFLKQFGGEILTEYHNMTVFRNAHFVRQIRNGKSAQFPMIGAATGSYHTPGNFIDGQKINHAERVITVDGLYVAPTFIAQIDELENHYDVRQPYAEELGQVLAQQYDQNVARMFVIGARSTNTLTGRSGGTTIGDPNMATDGSKISAALFTSAQTFDEKNIMGPRNSWFQPAHYYLLAQQTNLINKDFSGAGSIAAGRIETVAGIDIIKSNNVPDLDDSANTDLDVKYRYDFSATIGVVGTRMGVGTVQLMDVALETEWEIRRQGWFMLAKMAVGHDVLRQDCCIEIYDT
ncbi:MAG: phage capsid protein [bacterium]